MTGRPRRGQRRGGAARASAAAGRRRWAPTSRCACRRAPGRADRRSAVAEAVAMPLTPVRRGSAYAPQLAMRAGSPVAQTGRADDRPRRRARSPRLRDVRRRRRRRRHHRRRRRASTPPRAATASRSSSARTTRRARRAARRSSSTAACATCRTSTSASCARRCSSASSWSRWRRTSCSRCRSSSPRSTATRPDRRIGVGLNLYDVMSVERLRRSARPRLRGRAAPRGAHGRATSRTGAPSATA